jgi:hypothetical protein
LIAINLEEDTDCTEKPLFFEVSQQGPILKNYRDKENVNFKLNQVFMGLFDSKKRVVA